MRSHDGFAVAVAVAHWTIAKHANCSPAAGRKLRGHILGNPRSHLVGSGEPVVDRKAIIRGFESLVMVSYLLPTTLEWPGCEWAAAGCS